MTEIMLKSVGENDYPFLYRLLAERPAHANISHKKMPTYPEHVAFLSKRPYPLHMIIKDMPSLEPVGACYVTANNEIGIFILKEFQRRGYARRAVSTLIKMIVGDDPKAKLLANIAPGNEASQALFKSLGFNVIQHTYALEPLSDSTEDLQPNVPQQSS